MGSVFGYNTKGTTGTTTIAANNMLGFVDTSPADMGTVNSMSLYSLSASGTRKAKLVVVTFPALTIVTNGISNEIDITTTEGWFTATFATPPVLAASTTYVLMAIPLTQISYWYTTDAAYARYVDATNSEASPIDPTDATTTQTRKVSLYIDYTPVTAGQPTIKRFGGIPFMKYNKGVW